MGVRGVPDDDRPTVDLGPRPDIPEATESIDEDNPFEALAEPTRTVQSATPDLVHALPTQALPARSKRASQSNTPSLTHASKTTATPLEAMRHDEVGRTRIFLRVAIITCFAGVLVAVITGGDPIAFRVVCGSSAITTAGAVWMLYLTRTVETYTPRKALVPALLIAFGAFGGVYYWGTASPVAAMITYGIYFFSLGVNVRIVTAMYILVAILHAALGLGIISGVLEDRGLVTMPARTIDQIGVLCVIEFLYFIAFFTARISVRVTLEAMTQLESAARSVAQRDALLAEARAELDRALKVGGPGRFTEQVVGGFKLGVLIGRGGMGEVYEAHAVSDNREAAVKLLHPGTLADPTHVARFIREAQTASKLDTPHVVKVLEVGTTTGEIPFLAMERLRGHDLAHQLRRHKKIQLAQAQQFADQVAIGLEAAREAGIVHRDLKPHNVFHAELPSGTRVWKILDFGVSKSGGSGTLTKGHVIGTPAYMAPEQARGEDVDHRADVYSFAAILYRSVTGHPSFTGKDVPSMLYDVVYRVPTQPSILTTLPGDIDRVLAIGLAKDPRHRFATAVELARWFALAITGDLDPDQRRRADEVIAHYPWGTRPGTSTIA